MHFTHVRIRIADDSARSNFELIVEKGYDVGIVRGGGGTRYAIATGLQPERWVVWLSWEAGHCTLLFPTSTTARIALHTPGVQSPAQTEIHRIQPTDKGVVVHGEVIAARLPAEARRGSVRLDSEFSMVFQFIVPDQGDLDTGEFLY